MGRRASETGSRRLGGWEEEDVVVLGEEEEIVWGEIVGGVVGCGGCVDVLPLDDHHDDEDEVGAASEGFGLASSVLGEGMVG